MIVSIDYLKQCVSWYYMEILDEYTYYTWNYLTVCKQMFQTKWNY